MQGGKSEAEADEKADGQAGEGSGMGEEGWCARGEACDVAECMHVGGRAREGGVVGGQGKREMRAVGEHA